MFPDYEKIVAMNEDNITEENIKYGLMYPDRGGYTGFSFCWSGGFFEARFFVCGQWKRRIYVPATMNEGIDHARYWFPKWKIIMDEIYNIENQILEERSRTREHFTIFWNEIFPQKLQLQLEKG